MARIVPINLGPVSQQESWQRLRSEAGLRSMGQVPEVMLDGSGGPSMDIVDALANAEIALFILGAQGSFANMGIALEAFGPLWRVSSPPRGVLLVFETEGHLSVFRPQFAASGVEMVSAEQPAQVGVVLSKFTNEIQTGSRLPVSRFVGDLKAVIIAKSESSATGEPINAPPEPPAQRETPPVEGEPGEEGPADVQSFDAVNSSEFTEQAWRVLEAARRLGHLRPRPEACSVRRLIASLILSGLSPGKDPKVGAWLVEQIRRDREWVKERLAAQYPAIPLYHSSINTLLESDATVASVMTGSLKVTIELARRLAAESHEGQQSLIGARHLLGAAVSRADHRTNVKRFLRTFELNMDEIRAKLIESLSGWSVADHPEMWRRILDSPGSVPEAHGLPTYAADSAAGPDLVGITREVEAMASLVSAWSVEPPLSIGLFGEWGSGKSFFMQKMKERVRQIAAEARKSGTGQKEFGYYKNIVQVEFNAWHYVEGNLWASLVEHIFSNLRLEGTGGENVDSEEHVGKRLEKLLGEVKEKTAEAEQKEKTAAKSSQEAEENKKQAEETAKRLEAEAQAARERAKTAEEEGRKAEQKAADKQRAADASVAERESIGLKDVIEEVAGSAEIRNQVQKDLEVLGISKERLASVQGLRDALKEASEVGTVLDEGIKILANDKRRWWLLVWVIAGPAIAAALVWGGGWLIKQQDEPWLRSIMGTASAAGVVIAGAVGFWKRYSPKLKPILEAVARLKEKRATLDQRVEDARRKRAELAAQLDEDARKKKEEAVAEQKLAEDKVADAGKARREAKDREDEAHRAVIAAQSARAEAEKLQRDAEALLPERRIAAFIQDRAGAKDYRRHLGVPALIRRDFEKLSAMFNTQRIEEDQDKDGLTRHGVELPNRNDLSIVNRIILYIDDLDRCPPEKVVEVLRAIHLLLAFPLFVVIVAVDARWMKRSLRDRFSLMMTSPQDGAEQSTSASKTEELALGQMATPDDYLEKIFQVPFWIRPLSRAACKNLVNALTKNDVESESAAPGAKDRTEPQETANATRDRQTGADAGSVASTPASPEALTKPEGSAGATGFKEPLAEGVSGKGFEWGPIEPKPRTLQLTKDEREYMVELAPVIGRSPRSVKRFVNCYRLLKTALDQDEMARATRDGTFRTTMLLLGMVTGLPDIAPALLSDLLQAEQTKAPVAWAHEAAKRLALEKRERWEDLLPAIARLKEVSKVSTIRPLVEAADLVDRFSFSPVRTRAR